MQLANDLNCVLSTVKKLLQNYRLFNSIISYPHHILNQLLPSVSEAAENYNLRPHKHNRLLPERTMRLFDANFICRSLCSDIYYRAQNCINVVVLWYANAFINKRIYVFRLSKIKKRKDLYGRSILRTDYTKLNKETGKREHVR